MANTASLEKTYQKKTDRQHILDAPDTYIGSVEETEYDTFVLERSEDEEVSNKITKKQINIIPGLYKLFDEGIVNCRDHVVRMIQSPLLDKKFVSNIQVHVKDDGSIVMENDGKFPWTYLGKDLSEILKPLDMSVDEFISICDNFTNKSLFKKDSSGNLMKDKQGNLEKINYDNQ